MPRGLNAHNPAKEKHIAAALLAGYPTIRQKLEKVYNYAYTYIWACGAHEVKCRLKC